MGTLGGDGEFDGKRTQRAIGPFVTTENELSQMPFLVVTMAFLDCHNPGFYCHKGAKKLSQTRIFTHFRGKTLIKLWYVPQFKQNKEKTRLVVPKTAL